MDWPPIGLSLLPADGNTRQDDVLERHKSLDSGSSCAEVAKTIEVAAVRDHDESTTSGVVMGPRGGVFLGCWVVLDPRALCDRVLCILHVWHCSTLFFSLSK